MRVRERAAVRGHRRRALGLAVALLGAAWAAPAAPQEPPPDPAVIEVDAPLEARLRTDTVRRARLRRTLRVPAAVELDPARVSRIDAGVNGRIAEVRVFAGDRVEPGDVLARLTSPELTQAQVALLGALAEVDLQRKAVERAEDLVKAEVISQAELERREKQLFVARMDVSSRRDQLRLMGMGPDEIREVESRRAIRSEVAIQARSAGTVIARNVSRSQVVQPGEPLFTVADLSHVRVEGQAPEREVPFLASAESVQVEIPALGAHPRPGDALYVGATVNPSTRTVTVRTAIDSPGTTVKPKMLARLLVVGPEEERVAVPAGAVVREGSDDHVFVRQADGRFRFASVQLQPAVDGMRAVDEGLAEGDVVVVDGAFRLNAERRRRLGR